VLSGTILKLRELKWMKTTEDMLAICLAFDSQLFHSSVSLRVSEP
jgi:hypothetical protein